MAGAVNTHVENRLARLEGHYETLSKRMDDLDGKTDQIIRILQDHRARELPPLNTILVTSGAVISIIAAAAYTFFWLVDARVGSAIKRADDFVTVLTSNGRYYVFESETRGRLDRLEHRP